LVLLPFAVMGMVLAWYIWHELPAATRKYNARVAAEAGAAAVPL
jgi:hypothetical protein